MFTAHNEGGEGHLFAKCSSNNFRSPPLRVNGACVKECATDCTCQFGLCLLNGSSRLCGKISAHLFLHCASLHHDYLCLRLRRIDDQYEIIVDATRIKAQRVECRMQGHNVRPSHHDTRAPIRCFPRRFPPCLKLHTLPFRPRGSPREAFLSLWRYWGGSGGVGMPLEALVDR